ncbi:MAG: hypothetical protein RLZZ524_417 [Pseudomonadota bacterium]
MTRRADADDLTSRKPTMPKIEGTCLCGDIRYTTTTGSAVVV